MAAIAGNSRNSSYNRPKLLRSHVTAPTLVTSYASHNGRCTLNFGANAFDAATRDRATTILSRVARSYVCSEKAEERRKQSAERNPSSSPGGREVAEKVGNGKSKSAKISVIHRDGSKHGAYFSFPSFEESENFCEKEQSEVQEHAPRVAVRRLTRR